MKILHVITGLNGGGAEGALFRLVTSDGDAEHVVISLTGDGVYGPRLRAAGVDCMALNGVRLLTPRQLLELVRLIRRIKPDVMQTWMYHADLIGGLAARVAARKSPVVWGIRHSGHNLRELSRATRWVVSGCVSLSRAIPARIVSCSRQAEQAHVALGYPRSKMSIIPNGYDSHRFRPDAEARRALRAEWGLADDAILLGLVARWDPPKDHPNLIAALTWLREIRSDWRCILVGNNVHEGNGELMGLLANSGIRDYVHLCGPRNDIPAVMNALDIHVLSSSHEAFPNVVAEAMSCGTPCVVTDAGDAALIAGDTGWVVPRSDSRALADAMAAAMAARHDGLAWRERQGNCRARIVEHFTLETMIKSYHSVWRESLAEGHV